jgi:hypothetical protein
MGVLTSQYLELPRHPLNQFHMTMRGLFGIHLTHPSSNLPGNVMLTGLVMYSGRLSTLVNLMTVDNFGVLSSGFAHLPLSYKPKKANLLMICY